MASQPMIYSNVHVYTMQFPPAQMPDNKLRKNSSPSTECRCGGGESFYIIIYACEWINLANSTRLSLVSEWRAGTEEVILLA